MSVKNEILQQLDALFAGRRDVYGEGYPDPKKPEKYRYRAVTADLTPEVLLKHLKGDVLVGVYPLVENKVLWFAVDFDAPKDTAGNVVANPFEVAWESAKAQLVALERAGLHVYLERSRSGNGVHVWGFLDEPVEAGVVRDALRPLLTDHEIFRSRDRLFPVQPSTDDTDGGLGNLIALPFWGAVRDQGYSSFLDPQTRDVIQPRAWLVSVMRNSAAVMRRLAEAAPKPRPVVRSNGGAAEDASFRPKVPLVGALKMISAYGCRFMRHCWTDRRQLSEPEWYAAIQQATCFQHGLEFAQLMSRDYKSYDPGEVQGKYEQALHNPPVGCSWVRDNFPSEACDTCPMKAPYWTAKQPILELVGASTAPMEAVGSFDEDISRIARFDRHELSAGIAWGLAGLDRYTSLRPSEMTVVGAMQSLGKTHLMVDAAFRIACQDIPVLIFSAETGRISLRQRLLARAAEVDTLAMRGERRIGPLSDEEWQRLQEGARALAELPIYTDYTSLTADAVLSQVESTILSHSIPLDSPYVIFFDYLQFGQKQQGDQSEYERLSRLSGEFKYIAKILEHPVVVFSQLKRENEGDKEPEINWFKGTGRIESDMDVGIIITGDRTIGSEAPRSMTLVKQREGPANVRVEFLLKQAYGRYDDLEPTDLVERAGMFADRGELGSS